MSTLTLPITTTYVRDWNIPQIVRELIQNGMDSEKEGFPLTVDATDGGKVKITNEGVTLDRATLCLGQTSKAGGGFAGKFGEGYKLAILVALRNGIDVRVRTGDETWLFFLARDPSFGNAEVIKVKIAKAPSYVKRVTFQLDAGTNDALKAKLLLSMDAVRLPKGVRKLTTDYGSLLLDGAYQGCVYAHGLLVCRMADSDKMIYGYDLTGLDLNRDRSIPDMWSLRDQVGRVLMELAASNKLPSMDAVYRQCFEQSAISQTQYNASYSEEIRAGLKVIAEEVTKGYDALAANADEVALAEAIGVRAMLVPEALHAAIKAFAPTVAKAAESKGRSLDTAETYTSSNEETFAGYPALARIFAAVERASIPMPQVRVGRFIQDNILGTYMATGDVITIKREHVGPKVTRDLIDTVIHELAHRVVTPHDMAHATEMNRLYGTVCAALLEA